MERQDDGAKSLNENCDDNDYAVLSGIRARFLDATSTDNRLIQGGLDLFYAAVCKEYSGPKKFENSRQLENYFYRLKTKSKQIQMTPSTTVTAISSKRKEPESEGKERTPPGAKNPPKRERLAIDKEDDKENKLQIEQPTQACKFKYFQLNFMQRCREERSKERIHFREIDPSKGAIVIDLDGTLVRHWPSKIPSKDRPDGKYNAEPFLIDVLMPDGEVEVLHSSLLCCNRMLALFCRSGYTLRGKDSNTF